MSNLTGSLSLSGTSGLRAKVNKNKKAFWEIPLALTYYFSLFKTAKNVHPIIPYQNTQVNQKFSNEAEDPQAPAHCISVSMTLLSPTD
jgi:hypothetical protein